MWCVAPLEMNEGNSLGQGYNRPTGCSAEKAPHASFKTIFYRNLREITFRLRNVIPELIIFVSRGITVYAVLVCWSRDVQFGQTDRNEANSLSSQIIHLA